MTELILIHPMKFQLARKIELLLLPIKLSIDIITIDLQLSV